MSISRGLDRLQRREVKYDRFARSAKITLNGFDTDCPYFFTLVQNAAEFESLREIAIQGQHFGGCVVRIFDAPSVIGSRSNQYQMTIESQMMRSEEESRTYKRTFPIIIDPSTEYLYYRKHVPGWITLNNLPVSLRKYLAKYRTAMRFNGNDQKTLRRYHGQLWNDQIADHPDLEHELIGFFFDTELAFDSATLLPPVPVVDTELDLETTFEINRLARLDATGKNAELGNYFILQPSMIESERIRNRIVDFVATSPVRLSAFKFKFARLAGSGPGLLEGFADFYERLAQVREQHSEKTLMVMESGEQVFPSAAVTFDFVSTSMTGFDSDRGGKAEGLGSLIDYRKKVSIKIGAVQRAYRNNDNHPSCNHAVCQPVSPLSASPDVWYKIRRQHYVLTMDDFMADIARYIGEGNIEQARRDLVNSHLSNLKELIPTNWGRTPMPVPP